MNDFADSPRLPSVVSRQAKSVSRRYVLIFGLLLAPLVWHTVKAAQAAQAAQAIGGPIDPPTPGDPGQEVNSSLRDLIQEDIETLAEITTHSKQKQQNYEERKQQLGNKRIKNVLDAAASHARVRDHYLSKLAYYLSTPPETIETLLGIKELGREAKTDPLLKKVGGNGFSSKLEKAIALHDSYKRFKESWAQAKAFFESAQYPSFLGIVRTIKSDPAHHEFAKTVPDFEILVIRAKFLGGVEPLRPPDSTFELTALERSLEAITAYLKIYEKPPTPYPLDHKQHGLVEGWSRELKAAIALKTLIKNYPLDWSPSRVEKLTEFFDKARQTVHDLKDDQEKASLKDTFFPAWLDKRLAPKPPENRSSRIHEALRDTKTWEFGTWALQNADAGKQKIWKFTRRNSDEEGKTRTEAQYKIQPRLPITEELVVRYTRAREQLLAGGRWKSKTGWQKFHKELTAIIHELHQYSDTGGLDLAYKYKLSSTKNKDYFDSEHQFGAFVLEAWPAMESLLDELSRTTGPPAGRDRDTAVGAGRQP